MSKYFRMLLITGLLLSGLNFNLSSALSFDREDRYYNNTYTIDDLRKKDDQVIKNLLDEERRVSYQVKEGNGDLSEGYSGEQLGTEQESSFGSELNKFFAALKGKPLILSGIIMLIFILIYLTTKISI